MLEDEITAARTDTNGSGGTGATHPVHRTFRTRRGLSLLRSLLLPVLMSLSGAVAAGPWHAAEQNTSGWYYMTPDERIEHQRRMRNFETYEECKAYQTEHHAQMAARARQQGVELQPRPNSGCEQLRRRGKFQ